MIMKKVQILLSFLMLLIFIACGGGGDSGGVSSSTSGGSAGNPAVDNPAPDGSDVPISGGGDGGSGDAVSGGGSDDTVDGGGTVVGGGGDGGTTPVAACNPLDVAQPFRSRTARSNIISFASAGPVFIIANSERTTFSSILSSTGKLEYWNADTNMGTQSFWAPPSYLYGEFKNLSYCFDGMRLTARSSAANQMVCAIKTNHWLSTNDRFLLFGISSNITPPEAHWNGGIQFMRDFSNPLYKKDSRTLLGGHHFMPGGGMFDRRSITSVDIQGELDSTNHYWLTAEEQFRVDNPIHIGGRGSDGADYVRATRRISIFNSVTIASIPLVLRNHIFAVNLYKHPSQNSYVLNLEDGQNSTAAVVSAVFSPEDANLELSHIIWDDEAHKIYVLGKGIQEIFVFDHTVTSTNVSGIGTISTDHLTHRSHFSIPTTSASRRSVDKAVVMGDFIFTLGKNAQGQNTVIAINAGSVLNEQPREKTLFESGYFDTGESYTNAAYDIKAFNFKNAQGDKGIVLKKDNGLKLYKYNDSICE